uniref:hypothetical protein n=1 Tax=Nocardia callitridis TaxID=648753 RepID=UPI0031ED675B
MVSDAAGARGEAAGAESAADRAADGACQGAESDLFPVFGFQGFVVALGLLHEPGTEVDAAGLQEAEGRAFERGTGDGAGGHSGDHALDELADRHAYGDLGGGAGGDLRRRGGGCADAGGRRCQGRHHLGGEDHQRRDDDVFGVFDVGGALIETGGLFFQAFDEVLEPALGTADRFPVRVERIVRRPGAQCVERIANDRFRGIIDAVEGGRRGFPRVGGPAHRRLVTLGPIARPDNPLRHPLERTGDLDSHGSGLERVGGGGAGLVLCFERVRDGAHVVGETAEGGRQAVGALEGFVSSRDVVAGEVFPGLVVSPAFALGVECGAQGGRHVGDPACDIREPRLGGAQRVRVRVQGGHRRRSSR